MGCFHSKRQKSTLMNGQSKNIEKTSKKYLTSSGSEKQDNLPINHEESKPHFTDRQKELVLNCWKCVEQDIARVGVIMFMNLFETHPDVQDVFMPFKGKSKEDLKQSSQLQSHALRVMGTVEKCLARMNDPKKMEEMLYELGSRHVMYSAKVDYIDSIAKNPVFDITLALKSAASNDLLFSKEKKLVGPQFIRAIQPSVAEQWTAELEEAWSDLFKLISYIMKGSMTF